MHDEKQFRGYNYFKYKRVIRLVYGWVLFENLAFGLIAAFSYGSETEEIILLNLPRRWDPAIFQFSYSLVLIATVPL